MEELVGNVVARVQGVCLGSNVCVVCGTKMRRLAENGAWKTARGGRHVEDAARRPTCRCQRAEAEVAADASGHAGAAGGGTEEESVPVEWLEEGGDADHGADGRRSTGGTDLAVGSADLAVGGGLGWVAAAGTESAVRRAEGDMVRARGAPGDAGGRWHAEGCARGGGGGRA
ncbi:hypothetical protein ABZP36_024525 [Zizania latifolia]